MTWHFEDPAAVARLLAAAEAWELAGTPFREFSRAMGGGIDCVGYAEELFIAAGAVKRGDFEFARTMADYQSHRLELRILRMLRGQVAEDPQSLRLGAIFAEIAVPENTTNIDPAYFLSGDLLVLRSGGEMHLPVMLIDRNMTHCARPLGVQISDIHDPTFSDHLDAIFRARAFAEAPAPQARLTTNTESQEADMPRRSLGVGG